MGMIRELNGHGDTKTIWDPDNAEEVANARATFNRLVGEKKFAAFMVKPGGEKGGKVTAFDPNAAQLILVPPAAGG